MSETLRRAVNESQHSRYAICKATGIEQSSLSRFMEGKTSLRLDKADALAAFLVVCHSLIEGPWSAS